MTNVHPLPVRNTDPDTSRSAALLAIARRPRVRDAVYAVLADDGPLTQDDLIAAYRQRALNIEGWPWASDSSIRTRCSELVRDGMVEEDPGGYGASRMGNRALVWRAVTVQRMWTNDQNEGTK